MGFSFQHFHNENKVKIKLIAAITGMLAGFYFFFGYIFPLIWPLALSAVLAIILYPIVDFMHRQFRINKIVGILLVLTLVTVGIGAVAALLVDKIAGQIMLFAKNYEYYEEKVLEGVHAMCCGVENIFHIKEGYIFEFLGDSLEDVIGKMQIKVMQFVIGTSIPAVKSVMDAIIAAAIIVVVLFLLMKDMDKIRECARKSVFGKELGFIYHRCVVVGRAYVKTQLIIMVIVAACSVLGLTLVGNRYAWILGISVGALDALPLFGSGVILVPLTIVFLIQKEFMRAAVIFTTFIVCYFVREYLEPKLMGDKMGVNPIMTLAGIYVGYKLFGFAGMFAGALAVIFVMDVIKMIRLK